MKYKNKSIFLKVMAMIIVVLFIGPLFFSFKSYANEEITTYSKETNTIINAIANGKLTINGVVKNIETIEIQKSEIENESFKSVVQSYLNEIRDMDTNNMYRIVIPSGSYEVDTPLLIYSNTILDCSAEEGVDIYANNGCAICGGNPSETSLSGYTGYENIIIYGGRYHGVPKDIDTNALNHKVNQNGSCTIRFGHATNVNIIKATIIDNCGGHHVEVGAVKDLTVSNCEFYGYADAQDASSLSLEAIQLDVIHREEKNFSGYGKKDDFSIENAKITYNYFHDIRRGIGSHHAVYGHPYNNIEISNNIFKDINDKAIQLEYFTNTVIKNNEIINATAGISCGSALAGLFYLPNAQKERNSLTVNKTINFKSQITNNKIVLNSDAISLPSGYDNAKYGIRVFGSEFTASNNKSTDEVNSHSGSKATLPPNGMYYASGLTIKGNTISTINNTKADKIESGIRSTYSKNITVKDNNINIPVSAKATTTSGITVFNTISNTVSGNSVKNAYVGIFISTSQKSSANNNTISNTLNNGLTIYKSSMENVQGNKITTCGNHAISATESSNVKYIKSNTIKSAKANGITIYKSTANGILSNNISNVKKGCIMISEKSKVTDKIYNNTINSGYTDAYAIGVFASTVNSISTNKISGKNKSGVGVYNSSKVTNIKSNNIVSPNTYGIFVYNNATANTIQDNTIKKSKKQGINISEKSTVKSFKDNKLTSCGCKNQVFISNNSKGLILNKTTLTLKKEKKATLKLTAKPVNGTIKWKTSNKKIVTVDKNGKVTAKKKGKATISATNQGITVKCVITVK